MKRNIYLACRIYNVEDYSRFDVPSTAHSSVKLAKEGCTNLYISDLTNNLYSYITSYNFHMKNHNLTKNQELNHKKEIERLTKLIEDVRVNKYYPDNEYSIVSVTMEE